MKLLIQIPQLIFGGAEKVLVSFANDLVARGHEVEVLETYEKGLLKDQFDSKVTFHAICSEEYKAKYYASLSDIKAERNPAKKLLGLGKQAFSKVVGYREYAEKLAAKYYADKQYDVAINYLEIDSPEFLLNAIHAKKYIQWYHTDVANLEDPESTDKLIESFAKMDAIICVAKSALNNFNARYPMLASKTHLIYNSFDSQAVIEKSKEPFSYSKSSEDIILLSVGRLTLPKKYLRFLDVLKHLMDEGFSFQWYVLGEGLERKAIESKINELNLSNCVHLEGVTSNPYKYMKNCDLFVLPSGWEGFPTVTIEAKLCGCAVLATDVSGIREQLVHGKTGWIVENNEDAILEGMKILLSDSELLHALRNSDSIESIVNNDIKYQCFLELIS